MLEDCWSLDSNARPSTSRCYALVRSAHRFVTTGSLGLDPLRLELSPHALEDQLLTTAVNELTAVVSELLSKDGATPFKLKELRRRIPKPLEFLQ